LLAHPWSSALVVAVALSLGLSLAAPQRVQAQCTGPSCTLVRPDGKGIIGLGLVGAELGLIIPALAGVRDEWWPYVVFPLIGAIGGGIGGWAVEQNTPNDAEVDVALMVIGMALVVPTIVGTLALTAYQPPAESSESDEDWEEPEDISGGGTEVEATSEGGEAPAEGTSTEGGSTEGSSESTGPTSSAGSRMREVLAGGRGLVRFELGGEAPRLLVAAPLPYSQSSYTAEERASLLLNPQSDFIVPVLSATF
jgi:hypothetical protein